MLLPSGSGVRWYTFAGLRANLELAAKLAPLRSQVTQRDNLFITLEEEVDRESLRACLDAPTPMPELQRLVEGVSGALKLQQVLPDALANEILVRRLRDPAAVEYAVNAPVDRVG